jgi:hypothetical protein
VNVDKVHRRKGNIVDKHPQLVETIIISAVCLMIPEGFILRPILSALGFGPTGPIKGMPSAIVTRTWFVGLTGRFLGSLAAWMQRTIWGAAVEKGSWFAFFQRAGMLGGFGFLRKLKAILAGILAL